MLFLFKQFLIGLKQNLREEDNLSQGTWPVPKVSSVGGFTVGIISNLHIPWVQYEASVDAMNFNGDIALGNRYYNIQGSLYIGLNQQPSPPHWFESTTLTFMVHRSPCTTNLVLLSRKIISRRKVYKHGSDMMPYVLLTRFLITRSDKHFYHFSNV